VVRNERRQCDAREQSQSDGDRRDGIAGGRVMPQGRKNVYLFKCLCHRCGPATLISSPRREERLRETPYGDYLNFGRAAPTISMTIEFTGERSCSARRWSPGILCASQPNA